MLILMRNLFTTVVWILVLAAMFSQGPTGTTNPPEQPVPLAVSQPNIVLVIVDDLGWHDVGFHGGDYPTTTIDSLAGEGVILDGYYTNVLCTPSRSELMTGRYVIHNSLQAGNIENAVPVGIPLDIPLLSEHLRDANYSTHHIGKWHLGFFKREYTPTARGFDSYYGYYTGKEGYFDHTAGAGSTGWQYGNDWKGYDFRDGVEVAWNETGYSTNLFTGRAVDIITRHTQTNPSQPLFMTIAYQAMHGSVEAPKEVIDMFDEPKFEGRQAYTAGMYLLDEGIKNVTDTLKATGLWENTVFVFISDNGGDQIGNPARNFPYRGGKGTLWEGGVHVPAFVTSPKLEKTGYINTGLVHVTDWLPTLVNLAQITVDTDQLDGYDIWPAISGGLSSSGRQEILHDMNPSFQLVGENLFPDIYNVQVKSALRHGRWKIITGNVGNGTCILPYNWDSNSNRTQYNMPDDSTTEDNNIFLFDLDEDPYEKINLAHTHPQLVEQLLVRLAWYNSTSVPAWLADPDVYANPAYYNNTYVSWRDATWHWVRLEYNIERKE